MLPDAEDVLVENAAHDTGASTTAKAEGGSGNTTTGKSSKSKQKKTTSKAARKKLVTAPSVSAMRRRKRQKPRSIDNAPRTRSAKTTDEAYLSEIQRWSLQNWCSSEQIYHYFCYELADFNCSSPQALKPMLIVSHINMFACNVVGHCR